MRLGYNTNGLAHHDAERGLSMLADIGYESVALTLDHGLLNPWADDFKSQVRRMRGMLAELHLRSVVETGARFLLDPRRKHQPTLLSPDAMDRALRIGFLKQAIDVASRLGSDCVSLWSGVLDEAIPDEQAFDRLTAGLRETLAFAAERNVVLGFEPEPGMFIDTMERFAQLHQRLDDPLFRLTLDVGHLHCQGELPLADYIRRFAPQIVNVHLEDMRRGVHEHLMFGEGEIDFPPVIAALAEAGYDGPLHVELSRHSHMAPIAAQRSFDFLSPLVRAAEGKTEERN